MALSRPARRGLAAGVVALAAAGLAWAGWWEPYHLLRADRLALPLLAPPPARPFRIVHLADLHVAAGRGAEAAALDRLLVRLARESPDLVAISGDLWDDAGPPDEVAAHIRAAARFATRLGALAPVVAVQGHSDHLGTGVAALRRAGVDWLFDEGRVVTVPGGGAFLLLGLAEGAGGDELVDDHRGPPPRFAPLPVPGGGTAWGIGFGGRHRNVFSHFDPRGPADGLARADGPLAWSGVDFICDVRLEDAAAGAGLAVHSRYPLGEARMIRLRRVAPAPGAGRGTFTLVADGTAFTAGRPDTGVVPRPGRWYRLRLATRVTPRAVRATARVWPADAPEPTAWQAWAEDRSPGRVTAGTVGVWGWGGGTVLYRRPRVTAADGHRLPVADFPDGWRDGARGSRLALALAKSPPLPPGTPRVVLTHSPDPAAEAAWRGLEAVLAGHTHGGQLAVPGLGALTTRDALGPYYDRGVFHFAAFNPRGWTTLYVNPGFGTSFVPLRFAVPPRYAVIEIVGRGRPR